MEKIKDFLRKKSLSSIFIVAAFLCAVTTLLIYVNTGVDQFSTVLSSKVILLLGICIVLGFILMFFEVKIGKYAVYLVGLWAWLSYLITQVNYIANLIADIDGNSMSIAFITTVLFGSLTWLFSLVSAITQKKDFNFSKFSTKSSVKEKKHGKVR